VTKRSSSRPASRRLAASLLLGCAVLLGLMIGLAVFTGKALQDPPDTTTRTDAIIALTGGNSRIDTAIGLLNEGLAGKLFISGVNRVTGNQNVQSANRQAAALFACCIVLGYQAANTIGNAAETADWMRQENYHSLRLVTADYHMQRALLDFRLAMPGITIIPHPIHPQVSILRHSLLLVEEYTKYLATLPRYAFQRLLP
jgi:uncharacterized SAM-binding protein YcdF (DUF218 family)